MPTRRTFITGLAATVGALTSAGGAVAAVGRTRRGASTLNVSRDMRAFGIANMRPDDPDVNATAIAVSPVGGAIGDPVAAGASASATLLTNNPPPAGPLTFLMVDASGANFAPTVSGIWPSFQLIIPSTAVPGVAGMQISAAGVAVARGGMFVA